MARILGAELLGSSCALRPRVVGEPTALLRRHHAFWAQPGRARRVAAVPAASDRKCHQWMGMFLHFFRVSFILDGPWYLNWLTPLVGLG